MVPHNAPRLFSIAAILCSILFTVQHIHAQDCEATVTIKLENIKGGLYPGRKVTLISHVDGKTWVQAANEKGEATFTVLCGEMFDVKIANYTRKAEIESSKGGITKHTFTYESNMLEKEKLFAMSPAEIAEVDKYFTSSTDTTVVKTAVMPSPKINPDYYALVQVAIRNITGGPLENETMWIKGRKRKNTVQIQTDKTGRVIAWLPKGDEYDISFKYNESYYQTDCSYSKGTSDIRMNFSYLGSKEIERRRKIEAERIAAEEKRLKEEKERFEKRCAAAGLTLEECHKREKESYLRGEIGISDTVVNLVFKRNKWDDMLVVCDVTGSMNPYVAQVAMWYRLSILQKNKIQFVFFNDGDDIDDDLKKIGATGGIYYTASTNIDSLDRFVSRVQARGCGGDAPENNMEALIKGVKMATPFKELVLIADNNAPVKDIRLLPSFHVPVHIIVCGSDYSAVLPDYLKVAWKTKGSVHTVEEDIVSLARLSEGQEITIGGKAYKIMGGEFIQLTGL
jgi:hypothetical protein